MAQNLIDATSQHHVTREEQPDHLSLGTVLRPSAAAPFILVVFRHEFDDGENGSVRLMRLRKGVSFARNLQRGPFEVLYRWVQRHYRHEYIGIERAEQALHIEMTGCTGRWAVAWPFHSFQRCSRNDGW